MTLFEVNEAAEIIRESADKDVNLIFGAVIDPSLKDQIRITVVATGYPDADAYVGNEPILAQRSSTPVRSQNTSRVYSAPEAVMRQPVAVAAGPAAESNMPAFVRNSRKESKLDIPPFLKMKSRD